MGSKWANSTLIYEGRSHCGNVTGGEGYDLGDALRTRMREKRVQKFVPNVNTPPVSPILVALDKCAVSRT